MEVMSYVVMMFMEELNGKNNINIFIYIRSEERRVGKECVA